MTKRTLKEKFFDNYLANPLLMDFLIIWIILLLEYFISPFWVKFKLPLIKILSRSDEMNFISSLITTTVALSGFIIAALTIMITVKASLTARGYEDSDNAMEYIFSTKHYKSILRVFSKSIIELVIFFILLYATWLYSPNLNGVIISKVIFSSALGTTFAVYRSIWILFRILNLGNLKKQ